MVKKEIVSSRLEKLRELEGMAAFRNILVHDYLRLDREKVYQLLQTRLK